MLLDKDKIEFHQVPDSVSKTRLSDYAVGIFNTITTRKGIKKAIKNGLVTINGGQGFTGDYITGGEIIDLYQKDDFQKPIIEIPIEVLFEDDYLAIVNKPPGILVSGNKKWTLQNALPLHLTPSSQKDALSRPQPIHRLDYPTSGCLLIGKTTNAVVVLNNLFKQQLIEKTYLAVAIGKMPAEGMIDTPIDKKKSISIFNVLTTTNSPKYNCFNLVELKPKTGRRHQLRKHLSNIGNPILGDLLYGKDGFLLKGKGLYLHAISLNFIHPFSKELIQVKANVPKKFKKLFDIS